MGEAKTQKNEAEKVNFLTANPFSFFHIITDLKNNALKLLKDFPQNDSNNSIKILLDYIIERKY